MKTLETTKDIFDRKLRAKEVESPFRNSCKAILFSVHTYRKREKKETGNHK